MSQKIYLDQNESLSNVYEMYVNKTKMLPKASGNVPGYLCYTFSPRGIVLTVFSA